MLNIRNSKPVAEFKAFGSKERVFGLGNEINANDRNEVLSKIGELLSQIASGSVSFENTETASTKLTVAESRNAFIAAFKDRSSDKFQRIGATFADRLYETITRTGFMRQIFVQQQVAEGSIPRHRVNTKSTTAIVASGPTTVGTQIIRDRIIMPAEFPLVGKAMVSDIDISQTPGDIVEDKYEEALEATQTAEDRVVLNMLNAAVGIFNPLQYFAGTLTPAAFGSMVAAMATQGVATGNVLLAADFWSDISTGTSFSGYFDPVTKYELMQTGRLGRILGVDIITDGFRPKPIQVLAEGSLYLLGQPQYTGSYTERGPVEAEPISGAAEGIAGRGWFFKEQISAAAHNGRAIIKGQRS